MSERRSAEDVLAHVDIVDFIAPHVDLKKTGTQYKGNCCFHQERTPSFYVSRIKQAYYCFGCGAGGDAISFVRMMYSLDFKDALDFLAGSPVSHAEPIKRDTRHAEQEERERQYLAERAAKEATELLRSSSHKHHDYLILKGQGLASALTREYVAVTPDNTMLVPMHSIDDYRKVAGVQRIEWALDEEKNEMRWLKRYNWGAPGHGVIYYIGSRDFPETIFCEGFATGLSLKCAVGPMRINIGVCFSAGNLLKVAQATKGPGRMVFADHDKSGTGQRFAEQTELPWTMAPDEFFDANDFHQKYGAIKLRSLILKMRKQ